MTTANVPFSDPTIPGLSCRDLIGRATDYVTSRIGDAPRFGDWHREHVMKRDLAGLDVATLRDIGLDREAL